MARNFSTDFECAISRNILKHAIFPSVEFFRKSFYSINVFPKREYQFIFADGDQEYLWNTTGLLEINTEATILSKPSGKN